MRPEDEDEDWLAEAQAISSQIALNEFNSLKERLKARAAPTPLPWYKNLSKAICDRLIGFYQCLKQLF